MGVAPITDGKPQNGEPPNKAKCGLPPRSKGNPNNKHNSGSAKKEASKDRRFQGKKQGQPKPPRRRGTPKKRRQPNRGERERRRVSQAIFDSAERRRAELAAARRARQTRRAEKEMRDDPGRSGTRDAGGAGGRCGFAFHVMLTPCYLNYLNFW